MYYKMEVLETIVLLLFHPNNSFSYYLCIIFITYRNIWFRWNYKWKYESHNKKWPYIPDHPNGVLITGGPGSGKTNALLNLLKEKNWGSLIDKKYLYAKDLS